ncbi:NAD(P)/FAD-dependent oxidoreductase [Bradyrhizobium sp. LHD-71]|uniref:NAD(P)/FAD-dependent oxidoreductase n=1 Tax=Bradyrhizobium sp. LHD-71 TaxID=3072141 RepID=UPI00280C534E|nr:NAD(P)/FAD-dependent oxidoreductase [Bradyrhizobium sp. LHD-71]MDQ8726334.1 NAD(P)/FAD-dependent oxidoreductase [Bradyrhizobium sp. LHD-71]
MSVPANEKHGPRVVIVGAGFGGLTLAKGLAESTYDVTVIDRHNYYLFQPLLYQVATAALSPADIAAPIRAILRGQANTTVVLADVSGIDVVGKQVIVEDRRFPYDLLLLATGAQHAYFGHDDWAEFAPGLKTIDDATYLRRQILLAFERAEASSDAAERAQLLTLVIVGGGPTGVEMAGAIAELAKRALAADFRNIDPKSTRVVLLEGGPRLLPTFHPSLSEKAQRSLEDLGVEVRLGAMVTACSADAVAVGDERIETRTIMWAAGVKASPAARWLDVPTDRVGRVKVEPDLSVPGHPDIFVLGDTALVLGADGQPLPGVAPVAKQQGAYLAKLLVARTKGRTLPPFRYRDYGSLATIGRSHAVVDFGKVHLSGFVAWLLWSFAHIYFLIGFRRRAIVALHWAWSYITFQRGMRLITGSTGSRLKDDAGKEGEGARMRGVA